MILLALLLALAIFSLQTLANPIAVPGITFAVLHFTAYTKNSTLTHPSGPSLDSSTAYNTVFFVARDDDDDVLAICTAYTHVPLWKDGTSYPCHIIKGSEGDKMWFSVGENLREVVVQKMWNWDG